MSVKSLRKFLKTDYWKLKREQGFQSDQDKKMPFPPLQKKHSASDRIIDLLPSDNFNFGTMPLIEVIRKRRSRRKYLRESLSMAELSFLLWSTQGVLKARKIFAGVPGSLRTVPSGGARHPFETYLAVNNINGLAGGLYRYLPMEHKLLLLNADDAIAKKVAVASNKQLWLRHAAVIFIWAAIPYRTEYRYSFVAAKTVAQESGHICQNLYLAAESIGAGTCGVGAYDQKEIDRLIGVDGKNEFAVYIAPVGKIAS